MKKIWWVMFCLLPVSPAFPQVCDCKAVSGWTQEGGVREYDAENLFEYMDGNAEGYIIYNFEKMKGITCKSGEKTILVDVSEISDPEFAYGLFSSNRNPNLPTEKIGIAGQVTNRRIIFVKDKFYVELAANPEGDHTAALRAFASIMEKQISGRDTPPEALGWFSSDGLVKDSVRLVPQSVLGLRVLPRGYVGLYDFGKAFLVQEASAESASQVINKLKERLGQTKPLTIADESFSGTDRYLDGMVIFRKGKVIGGFANLKGGRDASAEAAKLAARIP
jgi:hypothetical protein